jgi:hypothetical protein
MRLIILCITIILFCQAAFAAKLEDVDVLDIKLAKEGYELKLRDLKRSPEGHFIVKLDRDDKEAFEKLALVIKKVQQKDNFKLVLDIVSFSAKPAGSQYRSSYVKFQGSALGESLLTH